jgi:probable HAF family extracellular repeat protein
LGTLGGTTSTARGINNSGQVTGWSRLASGDARAFRWTPTVPNGTTGTMQNLGTLKSYYYSVGTAINNLGDVAGYGGGPFGIPHALLWVGGGTAQDVGGGSSTTQSEAYGINNAGQVVGVRWDKGTFLSQVVNGKRKQFIIGPGRGLGINSSGQVIIHDGTDLNKFYLWTPNTPNGTTGSLILLGNSDSGGINDNGEVVFGRTLYLPAPNYGLPAGLHDLGALPSSFPQYDNVQARSINISGQVVGWQESVVSIDGNGNPTFAQYVWIWDSVNGMRDLSTLIPAGSGWVLQGVADINDAGQIVGTGLHNGVQRAFLLTP